MSWLERPEKKSSNPAKKFLEWKSDEKCFMYYDKAKKENVKVELPFSFVILEHYHTVKGWNDKSESGIYANEVLSIGLDELEVKAFKGGLISKGLYKEIKPVIQNAGGHYSRSIYAVTNEKEIINISLKGSGVSSYSEFINNFGDNNFDKNWIEVNEAKEMKKGRVKYSVPVFSKGKEITKREALEPFAEELHNYMVEYFKGDKNVKETPVEYEEVEDEVAF